MTQHRIWKDGNGTVVRETFTAAPDVLLRLAQESADADADESAAHMLRTFLNRFGHIDRFAGVVCAIREVVK